MGLIAHPRSLYSNALYKYSTYLLIYLFGVSISNDLQLDLDLCQVTATEIERYCSTPIFMHS